MKLDPEDVKELEEQLAKHDGLTHLRVKKRGDSLIIYSGASKDAQNHARLTCLGRDDWELSFPKHTGRWERTPFTGKMEEILDTLVFNFRYHLEVY